MGGGGGGRGGPANLLLDERISLCALALYINVHRVIFWQFGLLAFGHIGDISDKVIFGFIVQAIS